MTIVSRDAGDSMPVTRSTLMAAFAGLLRSMRLQLIGGDVRVLRRQRKVRLFITTARLASTALIVNIFSDFRAPPIYTLPMTFVALRASADARFTSAARRRRRRML